MIATAAKGQRFVRFGQGQHRRRIGGHGHIHGDFAALAPPRNRNFAVDALIFQFRVGDALDELRAQGKTLIAGLQNFQPAQLGVQPVADGAIGVVVQAVHIGGVKAAVRADGIPALPDRGGTHLDLIQPAGVVLLQKQPAGKVVLAVFGQGQAGKRRADKPGQQMRFVRTDILFQRSQKTRAELIRHHVKVQRQNQGGLRFADKAPGGGHILGAERPHKLLTATAPAARVLGILQNGGGIRKDLQAPRKADIGGKVVIRCALALVAQGVCLGVQPQPVAVLEAGLPQSVFAALTLDKLDPMFHTVVAVLQNALIAVSTVERPRQHRHHIAPERRAVLLIAQDVRHDLRHTDIGAQLACQIAQPLGHKGHNVLVECRRGAEGGHVAGPAQTLAALRAVGGNIQKVIPLAPLDVLLQAVHPLVGAGKNARLLQIRGKMARRKLHVLPVLQPLDTEVAEPMPCKMRVQNLLAAA